MADGRIDWPGIAEAVVLRLRGEPNPRLSRGRRWRYGQRGSLSVDLDKGAWFDFEAGAGGGLSKLVERQIGGDWKAARRWLEEQGLIEPWKPARGGGKRPVGRRAGRGRGSRGGSGGESSVGRPGAASRGGPCEGEADGKAARRIAFAAALWAEGLEAARSPVSRYLSRRGVWPGLEGAGGEWPAIPGAVRWADRAALERADRGLLFGDEERPFPDDAAGAMVAAFTPAANGAQIWAVSVEALTAEGWRPDGGRWRKARGVLAGAACRMAGNPHGRELALVEGELDAVAVAFAARYGLLGLGDVAEVRAVAGTSGFQPDRAADVERRPVVLLPDGPGRDGRATAAAAAAACGTRLRAEGRIVSERIRDAGDDADDPAADLASLLFERAARFDVDGTEPEGAEAEAWRALMGLPERAPDGKGAVTEAGREFGPAGIPEGGGS